MRSLIPFIFIAFFSLAFYIQTAGQERPELKSVNPDNDSQSEIKSVFDPKDELCVPEYSTGCSMGDGFTDFAVEEIQNYGSGCEDLNGTGWSQYLELGPALLLPGNTHDFTMQTGYADQFVTIWIDFNDDFELTSNEKILVDFEMENTGQFYTVSVEIPEDAIPGMHYMRARTNWQSSASDPCESYSYGEAEDYYVIIGSAEYGTIQGVVTELEGGAAVEDAVISLVGDFSFSTTTAANGSYFLENVFTGLYNVTCQMQGYNLQDTTLTIEEDVVVTKNFALTQPSINVTPLSINLTLPPNSIHEENISIENSGNGPLNWSSSVQLLSEQPKDYFDLQFEFPAAGGSGEAGIETDGEFIYTTQWNGAEFHKYDLEGNYIETFTVPGISGIRDLAFDGTYFYGSPAIPVVSEIDLTNKVLMSTFNAPTPVRAIAYDDNQDAFYANNWSSQVYKFDKTGNTLDIFDTGPYGANYYGFAYDMASPGGPFLWGYAHTGESLNEVIQMQLPSGNETGFVHDITNLISGPVYNMAGGLFTHPNLVFGKWSLGGVVQNEIIWGVDLGDAQTWVGVQPNLGTLMPSESELISVLFETNDLTPGEYQAEILFTSFPEVGNPAVDVFLTVSDDSYFPCNLSAELSCTDIILNWSVCPDGAPLPDSFGIYRDQTLINYTVDTMYTDSMLVPETFYSYNITAWYDGQETASASLQEMSFPYPDNLEPLSPEISINGINALLEWEPPIGCLTPDGYNIYRDNVLLGYVTQNSMMIDWGNHSYFITAVYYFGESQPSETVIMTGTNKTAETMVQAFPNPVKDFITIRATWPIEFIDCYSVDGILLKHIHVDQKQYVLDCRELQNGIYYLTVKHLNGIYNTKIIVW